MIDTLFSPPAELTTLFNSLESGNLTAAKEIIARSPKLLITKMQYTDCNGRTFPSISPWEYLLWSGNTYYPIEMIKLYLTDPDFKTLLRTLSLQESQLSYNGIAYSFKGEIFKDNAYSLQPIIDLLKHISALKHQVAPKELDFDQATLLWNQFRDLQNQMPKHFRFELCRDDRRWDPKDHKDTGFTLPDCHEQPFSSSLKIHQRDECFGTYDWQDEKGLIEGLSLVVNGARLTYKIPFSLEPDLLFYKTIDTARSRDRYLLQCLLKTLPNQLAEEQSNKPGVTSS